MRDQRNQRVIAIAQLAEHITAQKVTDALANLQGQRARAADGPDRGESAGRGTSSTSTTERNATEAHRLGLLIEDGRDFILGLEIAHKALLQWANDNCKTRAFGAPVIGNEVAVALCRDNQHGREGVIEWGRPDCLRIPVKAGLCTREYQAWYRYRLEHGISIAKDFEEGAA